MTNMRSENCLPKVSSLSSPRRGLSFSRGRICRSIRLSPSLKVLFLSRLQAYFLAQGKTFTQDIKPGESHNATKKPSLINLSGKIQARIAIQQVTLVVVDLLLFKTVEETMVLRQVGQIFHINRR